MLERNSVSYFFVISRKKVIEVFHNLFHHVWSHIRFPIKPFKRCSISWSWIIAQLSEVVVFLLFGESLWAGNDSQSSQMGFFRCSAVNRSERFCGNRIASFGVNVWEKPSTVYRIRYVTEWHSFQARIVFQGNKKTIKIFSSKTKLDNNWKDRFLINYRNELAKNLVARINFVYCSRNEWKIDVQVFRNFSKFSYRGVSKGWNETCSFESSDNAEVGFSNSNEYAVVNSTVEEFTSVH